MSDANTQIPNVVDAFSRIPEQGDIGEIGTGYTDFPQGGHLQGIQRSYVVEDRAATMIISGSSASESYLLARSLPLPLNADSLSAPICASEPEDSDDVGTVLHYHKLSDAPLKHAGGIQIIGQYLVVGLEDDSKRE